MTGTIRLATAADAADVRSIYAPYVEETAVAFEETAPTTAAVRRRIEDRLDRFPWVVCERADGVVGYACADRLRETPPYAWTVELSVYVADAHRRSGVGRALYGALLELLRTQGFCDAYAVTTLPNPASVRFHDAAGFERVGRFPAVGYTRGEWWDVQWWHRQLRERPASPDPPTPLSDVRGTEPCREALRAGTELLRSSGDE